MWRLILARKTVASRVGQTHTRKQKLVTSEVNRIKMMYSYWRVKGDLRGSILS